MTKLKRLSCLLIAVLLLVPFTASALGLEASNRNININDADEFIEFVNFCALDSWSKNKTVTLNANIDLSGYPDVSVGSFGGTFDGAGHKISGLKITDSGSYQGLFRYLQSGGIIKDLTVTGTIAPSGEAQAIGGIVGENSGTVQSTVFNGTVSGTETVGGIVGINAEGGKVIECTFKGTVSGTETVGGIAGENAGTLSKCVNESAVCTDPLTEELFDIGGIVGHSTGDIQSCQNNGDVGINHIGYNIGGIVGRQEGVTTGSLNYGAIYGRKDVGGIAGQAEPSIAVLLTDDLLVELSDELTKLNAQLGSFTASPDISGDLQKKLNNASNYLSTASSSANSLMSQLEGAVSGSNNSGNNNNNNNNNNDNSTTTTTDNSAQVIYENLGNYAPIFSTISEALGALSEDNDQLILLISDLITAENNDAKSLTDAQTAANAIKTALSDTDKAVTDIGTHVVSLRNAVYDGNENSMNLALEDLTKDLTALGDGYEELANQIKALGDGLDGLLKDTDKDEACQKAFDELSDAFSDFGEHADEISEILDDMEAKTDVNWSSLRSDLSKMADAAEKMGADSAKKAAESLYTILDEYEPDESMKEKAEKLTDLAKDCAEHLNAFSDDVIKVQINMNELSKATVSTGSSTGTSSGTSSGTSTGSSTGSTATYNAQSQALYKAIVSLSSEITDIGTVISKDSSGKQSEQAKAINDQMFKVMELMVSAMEDSGNAGSVTDVSESTAEKAAAGKLGQCSNHGTVTGDRDVGGIVGSMAIEGENDPEAENGDPFSAEHQYEIMDVVTACLNDGEIRALSSCVGGVIGRMELGTALGCENYGSVAGGDYTGGIAGRAVSAVKNSYNKSAVTGAKYVGGIAGYAVNLDSNYSIVRVRGDEYVGSIAGQIDNTDGKVKNNIFLTNDTGAIDGVSYAGVAEPMTVESIRKRAGIPAGFAVFSVKCMVDGEIYETVTADYRTLTKDIQLPDVPERDGKAGRWSDFELDRLVIDQTVYAVYDNPRTLISSVELDNGIAFVLADGNFTKYAVLHVYDSEAPAPSADSWAVWDVILSDDSVTEETKTNIRLLNQSGNSCTVWQLVDGEWVEVPSVSNGSYMIVSMTGETGTFCLRPDYTTVILLAVIIGAASLCAIVVIFILVLRHRRKHPPRRRKADRPNPKLAEEQTRPMYLSPEFTESVMPRDEEPTAATPYFEPEKLPEEDNPLIIHASEELEKWSDIMEGDPDWDNMTAKERRAYKKQKRAEARLEKKAIKSAEKQAKAEAKAAQREARRNR